MNKKFDHILVITQWERQGYAGIEAAERWRNDSNTGWNWRKYNDNPGKWTPPTEAIKLYSQCNLYTEPNEEHLRELYGMEVTMDETIKMRDLDQAEANIKRMKTIQKKYNAMCEKYGNPESFARFAAYIADAIGATLAEYSPITGDYIELSFSELEYKERKLTGKK